MIMLITADRYELPVAVYDTVQECARSLGTTSSDICRTLRCNRTSKAFGKRMPVKFLRLDDKKVANA